jgi:hypothetical protein
MKSTLNPRHPEYASLFSIILFLKKRLPEIQTVVESGLCLGH